MTSVMFDLNQGIRGKQLELPEAFSTHSESDSNRDKKTKTHDKPRSIPAPLVKRVSYWG